MTVDLNIDDLRRWIDREERDSEVMSAMLVRKFNATFDRTSGEGPGDEAPLLIHLCFAQSVAPMIGLGLDGHPARGSFLPPIPLPRRMWAGGALAFHGPLHIGEEVSRRSIITDVRVKEGRSGALCFVTVEHEVTGDGRPVVSERQDIVYRGVSPAGKKKDELAPAAPGVSCRTVTPHPALLFRYSALTFNGHRIHYDRPYCVGVEGYPGLVVHGPLQATMLCQDAADRLGERPRKFSFRALSPIFDDADFTLNAKPSGEGLDLWTARTGGPVAMQARAVW